MRIMHNIPALQGVNSLAAASGAMSKAVARLSTGLRINSAADDAAGLAISEKMRAQTLGLDRASLNAQDGISLLRTAEGALGDVHSILQRMRELSVYAASDGLTAQDREYIQIEIDQLTKQITDISTQTQFNRKTLLDGGSSVLWGTSTSDIGVLVTGTLLRRDQFGSVQSNAGNYKITFNTAQVGRENIQKSNIFTLKHGTLERSVVIDPRSGLTNVRALNMVEGEWRIETRETPFGGVRYYQGGMPVAPAQIGAASLDATAPPSLVAPGEYDVRLSDRVPMMADFTDALAAGAVEGIRTSSVPLAGAGARDFDAQFELGSANGPHASDTALYRNYSALDIASGVGTVTPGPADIAIATDADAAANVFMRYTVDGVSGATSDLSAETFVEESYAVATDAAVDVTLTYRSKATDGPATATLTYETGAAEAIPYTSTFRTNLTAQWFINLPASSTIDRRVDIPANSDAQGIVEALNKVYSGFGIKVSKTTTNGRSYIEIKNESGEDVRLSYKRDPDTGDSSLMSYLFENPPIIIPAGGIKSSNLIDDGRTGWTAEIPAGSSLETVREKIYDALSGPNGPLDVGPVSSDPTQQVKFSLTSKKIFDTDRTGYTSIEFKDTVITRDLGLFGMSTSTTPKDTKSLYNGFQITGIDTAGKDGMDLAGIAAAIEAGVGETGFKMEATSSGDHKDTLIGNNSSKYSIVLSGDTITELNGGAYTIARGATDVKMQNEVWNGARHRLSAVDPAQRTGTDAAEAMARLNDSLKSIFSQDGLDSNNDLELFGGTATGAGTATGRYETAFNNDEASGYDITLSSTPGSFYWNTKDELFAGTNTAERGANAIAGRSLVYQQRTQLFGANKTMQETYDAVNGKTGMGANWITDPSIDPDGKGQYRIINMTDENSGIDRRTFTITNGTPAAGQKSIVPSGTEIRVGGIADTDEWITAGSSVSLKLEYEGSGADGTRISGAAIAEVAADGDPADNAAKLNAEIGFDLFKEFHLKTPAAGIDTLADSSWITYTSANVDNATTLKSNVYDSEYGASDEIVYAFDDGALDGKNITIRQLLAADKDKVTTIDHHIDFGANASASDTSFAYGQRANAGSVTEWQLGSGTPAWLAQSYYGRETTYYFEREQAEPEHVIKAAAVNAMNEINASLMFSMEGGTLSVQGKGFDDEGNAVPGLDGAKVALTRDQYDGGAADILGIAFTDLNIDTSLMSDGDKFVVNVSAAAKLKSGMINRSADKDKFQSTANIAITGDPYQQGGERSGSTAQYRLAADKENGQTLSLLGYTVSPINGSSDVPGVGYNDGQLVLSVAAGGFADGSTVGLPSSEDAGSNRIHAEVNYQGDTKFSAGALVTSAYLQRQEADPRLAISSFVSGVGYSNYEYGTREDGTFGQLNERGAGAPADGGPGGKEVYNKMNGSLIFDVLKVENNLITFRVQGRMIDRDGNEYYAEQEELALYGGANTEKDTSVTPPVTPDNVAHPVRLFADSPFGGIYFDEFTIGDSSMWTEGDRFTLSLAASGFEDGMSVDYQMDLLNTPGASSQIDEIDIFSDNRGSTMPHSFRFNDGVLDNRKTDLGIYQLANNLVKGDSDHFRQEQVMDGTLSLTFGKYNPGYDPITGHDNTIHTAATFEVKYERGQDFGVAHYYSNVEDIAQFWDANGRYILESNDQMLTIRQGGRETSVQIGGTVELGELSRQISDAIWSAILKQHQQGILRGENDQLDPEADRPHMLDKKDKNKLFQFVNNVPGDSANESVVGTFLAHSVVSGASMGLEFYGNEDLLNAFNFATIQEGRDTQFDAVVSDAHSGKTITSMTRVTAGTTTNELLFDGVSLKLDSDLGILRAKFNEELGTFKLDVQDRFDHVVHLTDNALRLQIGANEGEEMLLTLGDMSAEALGIADISLRSRESAASAITKIDAAIGLVSRQRAMIGGQINRLEHTISSLSTASTNLTDARSRIVDADMAKEMMEKTKLDIVMQAGSAMLMQANQMGNNVMALLK